MSVKLTDCKGRQAPATIRVHSHHQCIQPLAIAINGPSGARRGTETEMTRTAQPPEFGLKECENIPLPHLRALVTHLWGQANNGAKAPTSETGTIDRILANLNELTANDPDKRRLIRTYLHGLYQVKAFSGYGAWFYNYADFEDHDPPDYNHIRNVLGVTPQERIDRTALDEGKTHLISAVPGYDNSVILTYAFPTRSPYRDRNTGSDEYQLSWDRIVVLLRPEGIEIRRKVRGKDLSVIQADLTRIGVAGLATNPLTMSAIPQRDKVITDLDALLIEYNGTCQDGSMGTIGGKGKRDSKLRNERCLIRLSQVPRNKRAKELVDSPFEEATFEFDCPHSFGYTESRVKVAVTEKGLHFSKSSEIAIAKFLAAYRDACKP
jgi:hypothetical protein